MAEIGLGQKPIFRFEKQWLPELENLSDSRLRDKANTLLRDVPTCELLRFVVQRRYRAFWEGTDDLDVHPVYRACLWAYVDRLPEAERAELYIEDDLDACMPALESHMQRALGNEECNVLLQRAVEEIRRTNRRVPRAKELDVIPSNQLYQFTQRAIARAPEGIFSASGGFPSYTECKNGFNASLEMRPNEDVPISLVVNYQDILHSMSEKLNSLGDVAVDVMDIILAHHMQREEETVTVTTDEILLARGIRPKVKKGYSAGYRPDEKKAIVSIMNAMDNLWIVVGEMEVHIKGRQRPRRYREKSRLMMITGIAEQGEGEDYIPVVWRVRLGEVFESLLSSDMATQYALLSRKTLQYDPYRQKWEKRLSRYLHPLWRIRQSDGSYMQPFRVSTLLDAVGASIDRRNPHKTKERFEAALERLAEDRVIAGWQYAGEGMEDIVGKRGWVERWLEWRVVIEPSDVIMEQYSKIHAEPSKAKPSELTPAKLDLAQLRHKFGITQLQLSEELSVSRSLIAQVERGTRGMSAQLRAKVEQWADSRA